MSKELMTDRLVLRPFEASDYKDIFYIFSEPNFRFYGAGTSIQNAQMYVERKMRNNSLCNGDYQLGYNFTIRFKDQDKIIGFVGAGCAPPYPDYLKE